MKLLFKKLHPNAQLPMRGSEHAAGYDLRCVEDILIAPGCWAAVKTGLAVAIPEGHYGRIAPRSGLAVKYGISVNAGVVDIDFRGEIGVVLINHGSETVEFKVGDRISQFILERISTPEAEWADELPETSRGEGGWGSTGR